MSPVALAPVALRAQAVNVAIFPLSGFAMGEDGAALAATVRDMLITDMAKNSNVKAVDRASIDELIRSRQLSLSGKLKDDEVMQLGALLGAQYALAGGITVVGKEAQLSLRIVDIETGENSHPFSERMPKDQLLSLVDKAAATFGDLKLKARVADVVVPVPSAFAYSRGLDYEKRGEKAKARQMYESALQIFPENAAAKTALARVK
jgi:TolB-like protein